MSLNWKFIEKVFFELESGSEVLDLNGEYKLYINATITGKSRNLLRHTMLSRGATSLKFSSFELFELYIIELRVEPSLGSILRFELRALIELL